MTAFDSKCRPLTPNMLAFDFKCRLLRMPREAKSANSDYGSFCATPDEVGHPAPKAPADTAQGIYIFNRVALSDKMRIQIQPFKI